MDKVELVRLAILAIGWPVLIAGSIRLALQAKRFHERVGRSPFGRLVGVLVAGLLVTMYSLGVTATAFMWLNPREGVPIVVPIFAGWFMLMVLAAVLVGRWTEEVASVGSFYERLEEANRARVDLVNRASHELGTPLTPLLIQTELLANQSLGPLTRRQADSLRILRRNLDRLAFLVHEMMDVARLQRGSLQLLREDVDLSDTLHEAIDSYRPAAEKAGLTLVAEIEPDLHIEADPVRVAQVVQNLVANAVRFTNRGGRVRVVARRVGGEAETVIEDTGVGFAKQDADKLFQPFSQLVPVTVNKGGVGLGLFIARTIVEEHRGHIWAQSPGPGQGATFGFSLPLRGHVAATIQ